MVSEWVDWYHLLIDLLFLLTKPQSIASTQGGSRERTEAGNKVRMKKDQNMIDNEDPLF